MQDVDVFQSSPLSVDRFRVWTGLHGRSANDFLHYNRKLPCDHRPVVLCGQLDGSLLKFPSHLAIAKKKQHCIGKRGGIIGKEEIAAVLKTKLRPDRGGDEGFAHNHGFVKS